MTKRVEPKRMKQFSHLDYDSKEKLKEWAHSNNQSTGSLEYTLKRIHKLKPSVVFLTQTGSIPYGFAFKEAWKEAYPGEKLPRFLTMDVKKIRSLGRIDDLSVKIYKKFYDNDKIKGRIDEEEHTLLSRGFSRKLKHGVWRLPATNYWEIGIIRDKDPDFNEFYEDQMNRRSERFASKVIADVEKKLERYRVKSGDNIVVVDEQFPDDGEAKFDKDKYSQMGTAGTAKKIIEEAAKKRGIDANVAFRYLGHKTLPQRNLGPWIGGSRYNNSGEVWKMPTRRYSGNNEREISKANVHYLKELGKRAGKKIKERKSLEDKLTSVIGVSAFILSIFFSSYGLTGNIVGFTNHPINFLGIFFFLIGVIGFSLSLRRK